MRRALVLAGVMLAELSATGPPLAAAAEVPIPDAKFELHEDGFVVTLKSEIGEEKVVLTLYRHGEVAYYETPAEFTDDSVKARFGQLGELDYAFTSAERAGPCSEFAEGTFEGTFDFTGENEYVEFEAPRARGTFLGSPKKGCKEAPSGRHSVASGQEELRAAKDEASLLVHTALPLPARSLIVFEGEARHRRYVFFNAIQQEKVEGMLVARGAQTAGPRSSFTWNLKAGTAHIDPPAPFTGGATFKRRPGGRSVWRGSLRAPMLGGQPFRLAGGEFQAQLLKGSPLD
jgi:hypothetical protein